MVVASSLVILVSSHVRPSDGTFRKAIRLCKCNLEFGRGQRLVRWASTAPDQVLARMYLTR
jgi:hypothetical protein